MRLWDQFIDWRLRRAAAAEWRKEQDARETIKAEARAAAERIDARRALARRGALSMEQGIADSTDRSMLARWAALDDMVEGIGHSHLMYGGMSYRDKCKRRRDDGPTPCLCCPGECVGDEVKGNRAPMPYPGNSAWPPPSTPRTFEGT